MNAKCSSLSLICFRKDSAAPLLKKRISYIKKKTHNPNLYCRLVAYSREGKQNTGKRSTSAATKDDMGYNNKIYRQIFSKCKDKHSPQNFSRLSRIKLMFLMMVVTFLRKASKDTSDTTFMLIHYKNLGSHKKSNT